MTSVIVTALTFWWVISAFLSWSENVGSPDQHMTPDLNMAETSSGKRVFSGGGNAENLEHPDLSSTKNVSFLRTLAFQSAENYRGH